jgi:hydrogenase expression/formation protein HypE
MAIAEDPIFPAPGLPLDLMGWFTVHIGASDVAVTGIPPRVMTYSLLLPPPSPERDAKTIIESISKTASELGITIAGGHTGWYSAVTVPIVGGVTVSVDDQRAGHRSRGAALGGPQGSNRRPHLKRIAEPGNGPGVSDFGGKRRVNRLCRRRRSCNA